MRKIFFIVTITLIISLTGYSQTSEIEKLNLDFENIEKDYPEKWEVFGSPKYDVYIDSIYTKRGSFSAVIENKEGESSYKALKITLPNNYKGKFIRLSGYIKTEDVREGFAGLWMRIDPQIAFENMQHRGITGTTNWKEYEIVLPLNPEKTEEVVLGGILMGKGKMWLDNLQVSIDGKDLDNPKLEVYKRELLPAEKDIEFDNGSNITFPHLNKRVKSNLEILGRIWGFIKYHHPEVAKGNYNWDYELFRVLPNYLDAKNNNERDKILTIWIEKYGKLSPCENCKPTSNDAVLKPDLSWIGNSNLSSKLKNTLKDIYNNRHQGDHFYVAIKPIGNPDFTNEGSYLNMQYPDSGFRLLSLFKYWNIIEYFFPNKHLTDKKWNNVLNEYIPKFINARNELEYELAALQVIGKVNDTHASLGGGNDRIKELRGDNFAPFRVEFVENKLVVIDFYNPELIDTTNIKRGDIITHLNGKSVAFIIDSLKPYYPSSNEASMLRDISFDFLRSSKKSVNLKYISGNQHKEQKITLYHSENLDIYHLYKVHENEKSFKILDGNIGYITLATIKQDEIPEIKKYFKDTKGIIIDIRNYPTAFVPFTLGSYFVTKPTPFVKFTQGNPDNPGEFTFTKANQIQSDQSTYDGKLVVLVNDKTQSQAEYTAMAFRAVENSIIVGNTTAGADGDVSTIFLPGGLRTMISGIGVYYPDGTETQRVGIVPDVILNPTIEGIISGKDEILEKAIEIINQ